MVSFLRKCSVAAVTLLGAAAASFAQKSGWVATPVPNISYNTDVGLNLGAFCDFFDYGDGSGYPNFQNHIGATATWASKGSHYFHLLGESKTLLGSGYRIGGALTYRNAGSNSFYGYNGAHSPFDASLDKNPQTRVAYYSNHREMMRANVTLFGPLPDGLPSALNWTGGLLLRSIRFADHSLTDFIPGAARSLMQDYHNAGLIRPDEASGGVSLEARLGLVYDSRDIEWVPNRGVYAELYCNADADLSDFKRNYLQLVAHWRHYVPILFGRLTFAYHLGFQQTVAGTIPWYNLNEISTLTYFYEESEGIGSRYTMRGVRYNRLMAAGYLWGNFELRARVLGFNLIGQHFDVVINPFADFGGITKTYRLAEQRQYAALYDPSGKRFFGSLGCGAKFHMNTNFILSAEAAKALDPRIARLTVSMSTTYMF